MTPFELSYFTIPLTRGQIAIVDRVLFAWLSQWKWHAHWDPHTQSYYARRSIYLGGGRAFGKFELISMHRLILGLAKGDPRKVDHRNGSTLDCRQNNLRACSSGQNTHNQKKRSTNTTGYKGVSWYARDKKYRAAIRANGKCYSLGLYSNPEDAHKAYCEAAKRLHGEFFRAG